MVLTSPGVGRGHAHVVPAHAAPPVVAGRVTGRHPGLRPRRAARARGRGDREARRGEHHALPGRLARPVARLRPPPVPVVGEGAPGADRAGAARRVARLRRERPRPALDRLPGPGELVLRVLGVGRRPVPGLGRVGAVPARAGRARSPGAVARGVRRAGAAPAAGRPGPAGGVRGADRRGVRARRLRPAGGQVGAAPARDDGPALDDRAGGAERAGAARRAVGRALGRAVRGGRPAGGGRRRGRSGTGRGGRRRAGADG